MILIIIIFLAAIFGIYWTIKTKKLFPGIITIGMVLGIVLTLFLSNSAQNYGLYIYMGFVALALIYAFTNGEMKFKARLTIVLITIPIFLYWLWILNHWHGFALLAPIFTLIVALAGIITKVKLRNELGFLVILIADAVAIITENWMKAN